MAHKNRSNSNNRNKPSKTSRRGHDSRPKKSKNGNCTGNRVYPWVGSVNERLATKRELYRLQEKLSGGTISRGKNYYMD